MTLTLNKNLLNLKKLFKLIQTKNSKKCASFKVKD